MKKIVPVLLLVSTFFLSCKKDHGSQEIWFNPVNSDNTEMLNWDSIAYTTINYSDVPQYKKDPDFYNPEVYSHSLNLDTQKEFISIAGWHSIVIKKFVMVGKSGKIMYYIPFGKEHVSESVNLLPVSLQTQGGTKSVTTIRVNRFSE